MPTTEELVERLHSEGLRVTRQRRAVLTVLCRSAGVMTPLEIHAEGVKLMPDLGLATVYRTLDLLENEGWLRKVHDPARGEGFVLSTASHGHHILCTQCGVVAEFSTCLLAETIAGAGRETGFSIQEHRLELLGLCRDCSQRTKRAGGGADQ